MSSDPTPVESSRSKGASYRPRFQPALACATFALFALALLLLIRGLGAWLVQEDPLQPAGAILVLSGSMPYRAQDAAAIYRMGYANEIWVSRPRGPGELLATLGIPYEGEEVYNREILIHEGVPPANIHVFPDPIVDTEEEVAEISRVMRRENISTIIIVTSPQHTRRVRAIWRHANGQQLHAIVRAAWHDPFDAHRWWRNTRDTFSVVRELMGLVNVWLGFPVHPHAA